MTNKTVLTSFTMALMLSASVMAEPKQHTPDAVAEVLNNEGETIGQVALFASDAGTLLRLELEGLAPGPKAIHIHSVGSCDDHCDGFMQSGGHLNPDNRKHGLLNPEGPDAGDLTNFFVHENGYAWAEMFTSLASLDGSTGAKILGEDGAALVIHENPDDHYSQPIGGAGARIACGVIRPYQEDD